MFIDVMNIYRANFGIKVSKMFMIRKIANKMERIHSDEFTNSNNFIKEIIVVNLFNFINCIFTTILRIRKVQVKELMLIKIQNTNLIRL